MFHDVECTFDNGICIFLLLNWKANNKYVQENGDANIHKCVNNREGARQSYRFFPRSNPVFRIVSCRAIKWHVEHV